MHTGNCENEAQFRQPEQDVAMCKEVHIGSPHMILWYVLTLPIGIFGGCESDVLHRKSLSLHVVIVAKQLCLG